MTYKLKFICALISGMLLTAAFPPLKMAWVAGFALVPLLKAIEGESPASAFRLGFVAGMAHFLTLIYWIIFVMAHYGGLPIIVSIGILLLFCLYLALFPATFALLAGLVSEDRFHVFTLASLWVALEWIRAHILTGFPWCLTGYSLYGYPKWIQIADITGVYGLSFVIVLMNGFLYRLLPEWKSHTRRFITHEMVPIVLIIIAVPVYGFWKMTASPSGAGDTMPVAVIQGNIDQSVKWVPEYQEKTIRKYHQLTLSTRTFNPELIVWPETAVPFFFQNDRTYADQVIEAATELNAYLIFGSPAYMKRDDHVTFYNRAYLLSPEGKIAGYYDKVHLVPFGEYVPLKRFLPFVNRLVPAAGDFAPGKTIHPLNASRLSVGVLICFEVIFPAIAREHVKKGADVLVNMTNDAWFGRTSAPHQHLAMSVFRAVENGRPLVRAANTGFSAFINHYGEITHASDLFADDVLTQRIRWNGAVDTFYTTYGNLFAFLILIITLFRIFLILWYSRHPLKHLKTTFKRRVGIWITAS